MKITWVWDGLLENRAGPLAHRAFAKYVRITQNSCGVTLLFKTAEMCKRGEKDIRPSMSPLLLFILIPLSCILTIGFNSLLHHKERCCSCLEVAYCWVATFHPIGLLWKQGLENCGLCLSWTHLYVDAPVISAGYIFHACTSIPYVWNGSAGVIHSCLGFWLDGDLGKSFSLVYRKSCFVFGGVSYLETESHFVVRREAKHPEAKRTQS